MIAYGTETTYQVYGSETPTPINPSPITSPTEWDMVSCGKQLFNRNYIIEQYKAVNVSYAGFETYDGYDAFYLVNGFMEGSNNLDFLSNYLYKTSTQYTISFKYKKVGTNGSILRVYYTDGTTTPFSINNTEWTDYTVTSTANKSILKITQGWSDQLSKTYYTDFVIMEGASATYTPYTGNTYPYKLEDVNGVTHNFRSLPDGTADSFNWETGELIKRTKTIVFDGTEDWLLNMAYDTSTVFIISITPQQLLFFKSSHFTAEEINDNRIVLTNNMLYLRINTTILPTQTVEALNTWLGLNNVTVQYKLETPITYQIKQYGETYGGEVFDKN